MTVYPPDSHQTTRHTVSDVALEVVGPVTERNGVLQFVIRLASPNVSHPKYGDLGQNEFGMPKRGEIARLNHYTREDTWRASDPELIPIPAGEAGSLQEALEYTVRKLLEWRAKRSA